MQATASQPKTVLIADDDVWTREMLNFLLADDGLQSVEASSGPQTVELARQQRPDIILLDIGLPGQSGLRVLEDLRDRPSTRDIPVVLVSGKVNLVDTGHAHDAEGALHKPLDLSALLAKIHEITDGR